ncbi:LNS2-domain-containing protein [Auriculariales sp. MPI-PUGE-AT-0066]|nr:LNS2-domain-containing protein [Auriculariales sp. MPI-PUGE-AT-0066]
MYYIRGAFNAATSYYKDLPAINPSTLTGAIDVIVVQRPGQDGGKELACSPFHVRFGKLQVLRPSDRLVTVQLNGKPVPFNMKIGEAGEAFWVFETDDDVPEELITSPALTHEEIVLAQVDAARQHNKPDEPDYFDLDAQPNEEKSHQSLLGNISMAGVAEATMASPYSAADFLSHASDLTKGATENAKAHLSLPPKLNAATAAEALELVGKDARPPEVKHEHGVALDMAGYHSREMSDRTVKAYPGRMASTLDDVDDQDDLDLQSAHRGIPINADASSSSSRTSCNSSIPSRARSVPPENIQLRGPEYEWEWGAFPLKTPGPTDSPQFLFPTSAQSDDEDLHEPMRGQSAADIARKSRRGLVQLGSLTASPTGDFLLDMDNKKFEFELSLCGGSEWGSLQDEESRNRAFAGAAVSYQRFLQDESVVQSPDLVIRWNYKYISRSDTSPLFAALMSWRDVALGLRRTATVEEDPLSSGDERSGDEYLQHTTTHAQPSARTTSTWSRWWRGSSSATSRQPLSRPQLVEQLPADNLERPGVKFATSEPAVPILPLVSPPALVSQSLPMSPAALPKKRYVKTLRLTSDQLKELNLNDGLNTVTFSLSTTGVVACTARIFLWDWSDSVVVSDIDGTITKSDALGHVMTFMGRDWTHSGIAKLYTDIRRNGYKIMYLTSRAIGQAGTTRHYLKGINQDSYQLPEGPVIMSPDRLLTSLHREVIMRRPEVFKMACLQDIRSIFGGNNPFYAGFGNRITDAASYLKVDIPSSRIFTVEYSGEVKMELLERAGYKSSYIHMADLVDQMFPPVHRSVSPAFTDLNYWRAPIDDFPLPDLSPPSPALSARSGRSTLSRFNPASAISLLSSRSRSPVSQETSPERDAGSATRGGHSRAQSLPLHVQDVDKSLEQLRLERERRDQEYVAELHRQRRKSIDSMPGSLPSSSSMHHHWSENEEEVEEALEEGEEDDEYGEDDEAEAEDAFDEDLLATGEMEDIPFL